MELIHPIFKWLHVVAGIMWIGLLYFFNFVNVFFSDPHGLNLYKFMSLDT